MFGVYEMQEARLNDRSYYVHNSTDVELHDRLAIVFSTCGRWSIQSTAVRCSAAREGVRYKLLTYPSLIMGHDATVLRVTLEMMPSECLQN